ncbi:MAG: amidohydrolase family protein [Actinobacteria bacterium]|nr:amidohydrolase family protein [Actinomycetota bacterium]
MSKLVLRAAVVIDGTGADPIRDGQVVIQGDRIATVGPAAPVDGDAQVVDYGDATLLPGLVNAHVHLELDCDSDMTRLRRTHAEAPAPQRMATAIGNAQKALASGVTTVRDTGGYLTGPIDARNAINAGRVLGPRVYACGAPITTTAGHLAWCGLRADTEAEVVGAVRRMVEAGADFIKVMATGGGITPESNLYREQYDAPTMRALVHDAHRLKRRVAAHVHAAQGCAIAIDAGVDTLEHCSWMYQDGRRGLAGMDSAAVERLDRRRQFVNVTVAGGSRRMFRDMDHLDALTASDREKIRAFGDAYRAMAASGVPVAISDDAGVVQTYFDEFPLSVIAATVLLDTTPVGAIHAATQRTAEAIGVDETLGALRPGLLADVLIVEGDAAGNICNIPRTVAVYLGGREVVRQRRLQVAAPANASI